MPTVASCQRAPLVDTVYTPLADAAVHAGALVDELSRRALGLVDLTRMTPLDAAIATKLGGYADAPAAPDLGEAALALAADPAAFVASARAAATLAAMKRDKQAMIDALGAARALLDALPTIPEDRLFSAGADALRLAVDLYRRTGQPFLLNLLEGLRAQLPDVAGVMHVFPFQREYRPETGAATPEEAEFRARMERLAGGKLMADTLAMCALMSQYSGSGRDTAAPRAGLNALARFHGAPCGAFAADPYLAGRDPARAVELTSLCAQAEAYLDALCATGDLAFAERLESLMVNALPDVLFEDGVRALSPANRLPGDESVAVAKPDPQETSAVLRALWALRRAAWLKRDDDTLALLMPMDGGCVTRLSGVPARFVASVTDGAERCLRVEAECQSPAQGSLLVRVPGYAEGATASVCGGRPQPVKPGELMTVTRAFRTGDAVELRYRAAARLETGYHGSVSAFAGGTLMALALPDESASWRYALRASAPMTLSREGGELLAVACAAPQWKQKAGFILPPPQGAPLGPAYELTLIPFAGTGGRIAAFPRVAERG